MFHFVCDFNVLSIIHISSWVMILVWILEVFSYKSGCVPYISVVISIHFVLYYCTVDKSSFFSISVLYIFYLPIYLLSKVFCIFENMTMIRWNFEQLVLDVEQKLIKRNFESVSLPKIVIL